MALKKVYFLVYPSIKVQILIFVFSVRAEHYCTGSVFFIAQEEKVLMRPWNSVETAVHLSFQWKKLGVLQLVSSIEHFDHFQDNNYARNGFEKS